MTRGLPKRFVRLFWVRPVLAALFLSSLTTPGMLGAEGRVRTYQLDYAPAPADNPLKGFVPYAGRARAFPHSLEFGYLPLRSLMSGPDSFTWAPLERLLDDVASRGCQTVFRVWLEYPKRPTGIPQFLLDGGLKTYTYTNTNTQPLPPSLITTPDYEDPQLRAALRQFILALGKRYDGDPRIGSITAGLLGTWGEWHTYPRNELWASHAVQREVMDAYEAAFRKTPVVLRYPAGEGDSAYAANARRRLGYHDDSFAWATLSSGRPGEDWYFMNRLLAAGPDASNKWKTHPIGGEIRPELWPCIWTDTGCERDQGFAACVRATHATWLMDSSTSRALSPAARGRAEAAARMLGYELHVREVAVEEQAEDDIFEVSVLIENRGVAPFYADWPVELAVLDRQGELELKQGTTWDAGSLMPDRPAQCWTHLLAIPAGSRLPGYLLMRIPNPLPEGRPLRFANATQDRHQAGWLTLGELNR